MEQPDETSIVGVNNKRTTIMTGNTKTEDKADFLAVGHHPNIDAKDVSAKNAALWAIDMNSTPQFLELLKHQREKIDKMAEELKNKILTSQDETRSISQPIPINIVIANAIGVNAKVSVGTSQLFNINFESIQNLLKTYYLNNDKYICRVIRSLQKLDIDKGCFINLSIVKKDIQSLNEKEKLKLKTYQRSKIYSSYEDVFNAEDKEPIQICDIFNSQNGKLPKRLFVFGRAGIGKSTLTQYISYQWAKENLWVGQFDLIFKIKLRNLTKNNYKNYKISFPFILAKECFSNANLSAETLCIIAESIKSILNDKSKKILIILDGYDEFNQRGSPCSNEINHLLNKANNKDIYLVVTSRPYAENINTSDFDFQLECMGFETKDIIRYILLEEIGFDIQTHREILNFLVNNRAILSLTHVPIILDMLCAIWDKNLPKEKANMTMTEFYAKLIQKLWEAYDERQKTLYSKISGKKIIKRKNKAKIFLMRLAYLAMNSSEIMMEATLICKTIKSIYKCQTDDVKIYIQDLLEPGLLYSPDYSYDNYDNCKYYFPHLTLQEFFSALYWADIFTSKKEKAEIFLFKNKYNPCYEVVWWFAAGLLKDEETVLEKFFLTLESEPRDIAGLYHLTLIMRCMDECTPAITERKEDFIKSLLQWLHSAIHPENTHLSQVREIILNCLGLSRSIFNHSNVIQKFISLLTDEDPCYAANVLIHHQSFLPTDILLYLVTLLHNKDKVRSYYAAGILSYQSPLPRAILDKLIRLLRNKDKDENVRSFAAEALSMQSSLPTDIIAQLVALLHDKYEDEDVIISVAEVLSNQSSLPLDILIQLVSLLHDENVIYHAAKALNNQFSLPTDILDKLLNLLQDKNEYSNIRDFAVEALSNQSSLPRDIITQLGNLLNDKESYVKRSAAEALSNQPSLPINILAQFINLLQDKNEYSNIRDFAVEVLSNQSSLPIDIITQLGNLLNDNDKESYVKRSAAEALSNQSSLPRNIITQLGNLLNDKEIYVKRSAADALSNQSSLPTDILSRLITLLHDKDRYVIFSAVDALSNQSSLPPNIIGQLVTLLDNENISSYASIVLNYHPSLLKNINIITPLVTLLDEENEYVIYVVEALSNQSSLPTNILDKLLNLLHDKYKNEDEDVIISVANALSNQSSLPTNILDKLLNLLQDKNKDGRLRRCAAHVLSNQSSLPQNIITQLITLLDDENIRNYALNILENLSISAIKENSNLIIFLIYKSIAEKISIYFEDNLLYVGNSEPIKFDEKEKKNFIIHFNEAFINLTGIQSEILFKTQETITGPNALVQEKIKVKETSLGDLYKPYEIPENSTELRTEKNNIDYVNLISQSKEVEKIGTKSSRLFAGFFNLHSSLSEGGKQIAPYLTSRDKQTMVCVNRSAYAFFKLMNVKRLYQQVTDCWENNQQSMISESPYTPSAEKGSRLFAGFFNPQGSLFEGGKQLTRYLNNRDKQAMACMHRSSYTFFKLAEAKHLYQQAMVYWDGKEYEQDIQYFRLVAAKGYAEAQFHLGVCYQHGSGVERDLIKAADYYQKASLQGHANAQDNLQRLLKAYPELQSRLSYLWEEDLYAQTLKEALALSLMPKDTFQPEESIDELEVAKKLSLQPCENASETKENDSYHEIVSNAEREKETIDKLLPQDEKNEVNNEEAKSSLYKVHGMLGKTPIKTAIPLPLKEKDHLVLILAQKIFKNDDVSKIAIHLSQKGLSITFYGEHSAKNKKLFKEFFSRYDYKGSKIDSYLTFRIVAHQDIINFFQSLKVDARRLYAESKLDFDEFSTQNCLVM